MTTGGGAEAVIGRWLAQRPGIRARVVIATAVGAELGLPERSGLSRAVILKEVESSLRRLHTDYIDLYQSQASPFAVNRPKPPQIPPEETLNAHAELLRAGKVRVIGASCFSAAELEQSLDLSAGLGLPRYESLLPLRGRHPAVDVARRKQVGVIQHISLAPLGRDDHLKYLEARGNVRALRYMATLHAVGAELRATPTQVTTAWVLGRGTADAAIASPTRLEQLSEALGAIALRLPAEAVQRLNDASPG